MKNTIISIILAIFAIIFVSCSDGESSGGKKKENREEREMAELYELGQEAVKVKVNEVHENKSGYSYADVTITIPDYTEIFMNAANKSDAVTAVAKALRSSDYDKLKYDAQVPVTYDERGKEIVHSEDEVKKLLEAELIKALNTVYEEMYQ